MLQQKLLIDVLSVLNKCGIDYMITGSIASSVQGEPRNTHDIDIVVNIKHNAVTALCNSFLPPRFYLREQAVTDAIQHQSMFNLIDSTEGDKIDFWILTNTAFDISRFSRKIRQRLFGFDVYISSPEDTILKKLHWAKESGGSEKQFVDALRVYELQYKILNIHYLELWSEKLEVNDLFFKLKQTAKPIE